LGSIQTAIIVLAFFCVIATLFIIGLRIQRARHSRAQGTLRRSEERYLQALESSTDGLWDWNILSDTVFYSDRFREILGYSPAELPGTIDSLRSRIHPEDADAAWTAIQRHLKERIPFNVELRLRTKAGAYLWFFPVARPSGIPTARPSGCPDGFRTSPNASRPNLIFRPPFPR
jgi:PAS domain S-box-containing protein